MIDQEKIHNQCFSNNPKERIEGLRQLGSNFIQLPDKQQAWNDLIKLTNDEDRQIKSSAVYALGSVFYVMPDKQQVCNDLNTLDEETKFYMREAAFSLRYDFLNSKLLGYDSLNSKLLGYDSLNSKLLGFEFLNMPDKQQTWNELIKFIGDERSSIARLKALNALNCELFNELHGKQTSHGFFEETGDSEYSYSKLGAACALGFVYFHVPDKQQAWNDLIKLTSDDGRIGVRSRATDAIVSAFLYVPDKQQAWNDLIKLISDGKHTRIITRVSYALDTTFYFLPDKQQAWNDLIKLTNDENVFVRLRATIVILSAFLYMPDKQQAWNDLHRLIYDKDCGMKEDVILTLGSVFSQVPDKQQAWNDLIKLTNSDECRIRSCANHSLGKVSIFKASQVGKEEDYKRELENAIGFFEKASKENKYSYPTHFCFPFYRSFHTIIFKKQDPKKEVDRYLAEAKDAAKGSKSKELLFEAVENLANALTEVQNMKNMDLEAMKGELNSYRKYCDRVEEIMANTEEDAPFATQTIMKGLPILDRNLKGIIEEIQNKAKVTCKKSQGTSTQEIASDVYREVQKWEIGSQEEMTFNVSKVVMVLKSKIPHTPENKEILDMIESMKYERDLTRQYSILPMIIGLIPTVNVVPEKTVKEGFENLQRGINKIDAKLDEMTVSLKPGPRAEIVISMGLKALGSGTQGVITIPLKEIKYPEVNIDLEMIKEEGIKLPRLPQRFIDKIKGYLL